MVSFSGEGKPVGDHSRPPPLKSSASLFLDFDGALANTTSTPRDVRAPVYLPDLLLRVRSALGGAIAILSNRRIEEIDRLTRWSVPAVAGVHGLHIRFGNIPPKMVMPSREFALDRVRRELEFLIDMHPKVQVEDKGVAISIHYDKCPESEADCIRFARSFLLAETVPGLRDTTLVEGERSIELVLCDSTKVDAIREFMNVAPFRGRQPIIVGHDVSTEDAFREIQRLGGMAIVVGKRRSTVANFALPDPRSVHEWLSKIT